MTDLTKRRLSIAAGALLVVLGFAAMRAIASGKEAPPKRERVVSAREVTTRTVVPDAAEVNVALQGRLVAYNAVPVTAEVTGVFEESARAFRVGVYYAEGDVLARINDTEARYSLLAQKADLANAIATAMPTLKIDYADAFPAWDAYLRDLDPEAPLAELPDIPDDAARFYLNAQGIPKLYYTIRSAEERLRKYTLRAPFAGTLTEVSANVGALVRANQPLGTLTATTYELAATVPVADLAYLNRGTAAELRGPGGTTYTGRVNRVSTQVDPNTQTATVFLDVRGEGLREGLYLRGDAVGEQLGEVVALGQNLLVGEGEVYVVEDSVLRRQPVEVVRRGGERVFVRGLAAGTEILDETLPGAYTGMRVRIREAAPVDDAVPADQAAASAGGSAGTATAPQDPNG